LVLENVRVCASMIVKGPQDVQVLEVATGDVGVRGDLDLAVASLLDDNVVAEVVGAALNLDALLEELFEGGDVEDLVVGGLRSVDDVLFSACQCRRPPTNVSTCPLRMGVGGSGIDVPSWQPASGPCHPSSAAD
jgi:hypothetical protein